MFGLRKQVSLVLAAVLGLGLAACTSDDSADEPQLQPSTEIFGYQVASSLSTTNAASREGVSVNAEALSARLYPAPFVSGPSGQLIPNTDLVTTRTIPGTNPQVEFTVTENARFSDGDPITCVDFQLAYTAGAMPELFDSHLPLMEQVKEFRCQPGSKQFTVVFEEGQGSRWRFLFGAGEVLPAHAIARDSGMDEVALSQALTNKDAAALSPVAEVWNTGFSLHEFNPELQVSSGPFMIQAVGEAGEVQLARNPEYYGDAANLEGIVVWPREASTSDILSHGNLAIAETPTSDPDWVNRDDMENPFVIETVIGELTDSLHTSDVGVLASSENRQIFNSCIDRPAIAAASTLFSGVEVPPVALHTVSHTDPIHNHLGHVGGQYLQPDPNRGWGLAGYTIRIGYQGPDARKAAMVEEIANSCAQFGITVVDASEEGATMSDLGGVTYDEWGNPQYESSTIDAFLGAVDPQAEHSAPTTRLNEVAQLVKREEELWQELPVIPLSATPRSFVRDDKVDNVVPYSGVTGIGWNMDRWLTTEPIDEDVS